MTCGGFYGPFFDEIYQGGPYTDFLRKYGPLYKLGVHILYPNFRGGQGFAAFGRDFEEPLPPSG